MELELYHYGVKGQRWGVRRFQRKDGSLTAAGKKRYYDTPELNRQKAEMKSAKTQMKASRKAYEKVANLSSLYPERAKAALEKTRFDDAAYRRSKLKYETNKEVARIRDKGIEFKKKSKHRLKLEEQFKKLGMDDEQAQAAANKRIRSERLLIGAAALTVTACAAYAANKARKVRADGIIKAGETLQRIEMQDTNGKLHDVFYVAKGEHDMKRYENLLGATRQQQTGEAYMMKLAASKDVKVASQYKCRKVFKELWDNDMEFSNQVRGHVPGADRMSTKQLYERFNQKLVGMRNQGPDKAFYNKLKSAGYGAIQDINDMKYSGYAARNPLIVFDNSGNNIMAKSVSKITEDMSLKGSKELLKATGETLGKDLLEKVGGWSAVGLTGAAAATYYSDPNKKYKNQGGNSKWH